MAKERSPDQLAYRTFVLTMVGVGLWIAAVFVFVL